MNKKIILSILLVVFGTLGYYYLQIKSSKLVILSTMPIGGDFSIPSTIGKFELKDYREKVVIIYFGYLFCPDICPTTLATLGALKKQLPKVEQDNLEVMFISVDPNRDTISKIKNYVEFFHPSFIGGTDTEEKIAKLARAYAVAYEKYYPKKGGTFYSVDHSTQAFIINKQGKVAELIRHGETANQIQKKINKYIKD